MKNFVKGMNVFEDYGLRKRIPGRLWGKEVKRNVLCVTTN